MKKHNIIDIPLFTSILTACAQAGPIGIDTGKEVHNLIKKKKLLDVQMETSLLNMYALCGEPLVALTVWQKMTQKRDIKSFSSTTYMCALRACALVGPSASPSGMVIYNCVVNSGAVIDDNLLHALLFMLVKCGEHQV